MLAKLTIKNVALIENAQIAFGDGLNVLSGETGAGKSVILDSVNFVLGAKADRSMIRYGESECFVKAEFILPESSKSVELLRDMDIDSDGEIVISRRFSESGKNSIKINGNTVTATMLRKVTDSLVDVHGQSEHFFLLKEGNQLKTLDVVAGQPLIEKKSALKTLVNQRNEIEEQIALLGGDEKERGRRLDVLNFQIDEIIAADWKEGEEEELLEKRNKLMHAEKIIAAIQESNQIFTQEYGVLDGLRMATRSLASIAKYADEYAVLQEKLENLSAEADDISETLSSVGEELYFDENEADAIERRLDTLRSLKRKYGANKAEVDAYLQKIQAEYDLLSDCEGQFAALTAQKQTTLKEIYRLCLDMTALRKQVGTEFCAQVVSELETLNIPHAQFTIQFNEYAYEDAERATANGLDSITFMFSANAGEPMKPLGKIISGGEMSRFMLAIKTRLSGLNAISTYIFDEIDAGISGKTAKVVAEKLVKISRGTQIIAVSHLAQIAAMSDRQYLIEKQEKSDKTITNVFALDDNGKIDELLRLLGGETQASFAREHAQEMLNQAQAYKKSFA